MRLEHVRLTRFRSIESCDVRIGAITALVGANNSGKSSFLRALNAFFDYEKERNEFIRGHHQYEVRSYPRVELVFADLPHDSQILELSEADQLTARLTYRPKTKQHAFQIKQNGRWNTIDASFITHLKNFIDFVLIPANRDASSLEWRETSLLPVVIDEFLARHLQNRDTVTPKFRKASTFLEKTALRKVTSQLLKFYAKRSSLEFQIAYDAEVNYKTFLNRIRFIVKEMGADFDINDCGSGIQSLVVIAMYRLLASLRESRIIIGVEEPEANLHPQAQKQLVASLKNTDSDSRKSQIVFTTHSTVLVDQLEHEDVVLVQKVADIKRGFKTTLTQIEPNFLSRHNLVSAQYYKFHRYKNSDFFYSKLVILVESENDAEVIRILMSQKGIELDALPISIMSLNGKDNLKYPFYLLRELSLPYFIILDKDYFVPYANGDLDQSRYLSGFPKYDYTRYQTGCLEGDLISNDGDRAKLLLLFRRNHSKALDLLEKYNIVCMKYSLDMDLVASATARRLFFDRLNVPSANRSSYELLVNRKNQIKKLDHLVYIIKNTPHKNLPNSYKRIKRALPRLIQECCKA